jgi:hypothetical protein
MGPHQFHTAALPHSCRVASFLESSRTICKIRSRCQDIDHLAVACAEMMSKLSSRHLLGLSDGLYNHPGEIVVGTACSGTDIIIPVLEVLSKQFTRYGFKSKFVHAYSCDPKPSSQRFILHNAEPTVPM